MSYLAKIRSKERNIGDKQYVKARKVYSISGYTLQERALTINRDTPSVKTSFIMAYKFSSGYVINNDGKRVTEYKYYSQEHGKVIL